MFYGIRAQAYGIVLLITGFHLQLLASVTPQLSVDVAQFRYDPNAVFVEIYYQASPSKMNLRVEKGDSLWTVQSWENMASVAEGSDDSGQKNLGRAFFVATEGEYHFRIESQDIKNPNVLLSKDFQMSIHPFPEDKICISDIEFASNIQFANSKSDQNPFIKNSLFVVPKPSLIYGVHEPILFFYIELYNVVQGLKGPEYFFQAAVLDSSGQDVGVPPISKTKKRLYDSVVEFGQMDLFSLSSGTYNLKIAILDSLKRELISRTKKFYYMQSIQSPSQDQMSNDPFNMSLFSVLEGNDLKREFEEAQYLMSDQQKSLYKNLKNDDAKRRMMFSFWRNLDSKPETNENEFYFEYKGRIQYADQNFSAAFRKGWKTDRGRVFCVYGTPSDIERFSSAAEHAPYEIWHYDAIEGGVIFIFADLTGLNQYILIHSTKLGEVFNSNYMDMINKGY